MSSFGRLVILKRSGPGKSYPLKKKKIVIGRHSSCDLRINLPEVSKKHAEVRVLEDNVFVLFLTCL